MKQCLHLLNCIDSFKEQGGIPNVFLSHLCILLIWPHQSSSNSSHAPHLQPPMPFLKHNILLLFLNRSHIIKPRNKGGFNHRFSPRADLSPSLAATAVSHCLSGQHKPEEHQLRLVLIVWVAYTSLRNTKFGCCISSAPFWQLVISLEETRLFIQRKWLFSSHDFNVHVAPASTSPLEADSLPCQAKHHEWEAK